jgi:hypothetical protein
MKVALLLALALAGTPLALAQVVGAKPSYLEAYAPSVPNEQAIGRRIVVPGLEDGWIPQGLAVGGPHVYVGGYRPTPDLLKSEHGPCRVWRFERATGQPAGAFDVPESACHSHAGGLAWLGGGKLMMADTEKLSRIDVERAIAAGKADGAIEVVSIKGMRGSFAASRGGDPWTGTWSKDAAKSRMHRLPVDFFEKHAGTTVDEGVAAETRVVPAEAQGAAFDAQGRLWTTASRSNAMSRLFRVDAQGQPEASFDMPMGLEGIAFSDDGKLWAVSESGTRKYQRWGPGFHFPFIFEIDVTKLR